MKLQSQISRKYKSNSYRKFWVILPIKIVKELNWKDGQELTPSIEKDKLIIEKS